MKKGIIFLALALMLLSCGGDETLYPVVVTNNASKEVTFSYDDSQHTLAVSGSETYHVKAHTPPPKSISVSGAMSVAMKAADSGSTYLFEDVAPLNLKVVNNLSVAVTIKAENYIESGSSVELTIDAEGENTSAKIYTRSPKFTATVPGYTVTFEWNIEGNVMFVKIL